jgi:hypothetical protein
MKWSREEEQFIAQQREDGLTWREVERELYEELGVTRDSDAIRMRYSKIRKEGFTTGLEEEVVRFNVKLAKQKQRFQDSNRVERKAFREHARVENAVTELNKELIEVLKANALDDFTISHSIGDNQAAGIIHITDTHLNELVELAVNRYDFTIASKRLQKLVDKAKLYFKAAGVKNVLVAFTGDLINSDRRLDELLSEATNRSKALFLAVQIFEQVIVDLNQDFNVAIASVTGNESRIPKHIGWADAVATDNYDFSIYNMLKYLFRDCEGVDFIDGADATEMVVNVGGQNVLLMHGNQKGLGAKTESAVQSIIGKWSAKGIQIDFTIFGHLHSAKIGDSYARSGSPVGANAYSENGLQLMSRASQNIHLLFETGSRDSIKVDLQNYEGYNGYEINNSLESYNAKSASKLSQGVTIFKVTI